MYITKAISINGGWDRLRDDHQTYLDFVSVITQMDLNVVWGSYKEFRHKSKLRKPASDTSLVHEYFSLRLSKRELWCRSQTDVLRLYQATKSFKGGWATVLQFRSLDSYELDRYLIDELITGSLLEESNKSIVGKVVVVWDCLPERLAEVAVSNKRVRQFIEENQWSYGDYLYSRMTLLPPITSTLPVTIICISETYSPLSVEEIESVSSFERSLKLSAENYEVGVAILTEFRQILNNKYPDDDFTVNVEQRSGGITLTVEGEGGRIDTYARDYESYQAVLSGRALPDVLYQEPKHVEQLESLCVYLNQRYGSGSEMMLQGKNALVRVFEENERLSAENEELGEVVVIQDKKIQAHNKQIENLKAAFEMMIEQGSNRELGKGLSNLLVLSEQDDTEHNRKLIRQQLLALESQKTGFLKKLGAVGGIAIGNVSISVVAEKVSKMDFDQLVIALSDYVQSVDFIA